MTENYFVYAVKNLRKENDLIETLWDVLFEIAYDKLKDEGVYPESNYELTQDDLSFAFNKYLEWKKDDLKHLEKEQELDILKKAKKELKKSLEYLLEKNIIAVKMPEPTIENFINDNNKFEFIVSEKMLNNELVKELEDEVFIEVRNDFKENF